MTTFKFKVEQILRSQPLAEASIKSYLSNMMKIKKLMNIEGTDFAKFKNISAVENAIKGLRKTSQKMVLVSLHATLKDQPGYGIISKIYLSKGAKVTKEISENYTNNELSKKQKNLITYPELLKKVSTIRKEYNKKKSPTNKKKLIMALVLIKSQFSPRLDLGSMEIITETEEDNGFENFLLVEEDRMTFILNTYKTFKIYGKIEYVLEKSVEKELRELGIEEQTYLIETNRGGGYTNNKYSRFRRLRR